MFVGMHFRPVELKRLTERGRVCGMGIRGRKAIKLVVKCSGAAEHRMESVPGLITPSPHREMRHPDTSQESGTRGQG